MTAGAAGAKGPVAPGGGGNPFWASTNLFSQANLQGAVTSYQLGTGTLAGGGQINPGNFLRGPRLVVRSTGGAGMVPTGDAPFNLFTQLGVQATDGGEILFNTINGYAYAQRHRFFRPWLQDPVLAYDYAISATELAFTLPLFTEVRQQLGVLANTDTRSQYSWTQQINTEAAVVGAATTSPTVSVTPYTDMWAQPDGEDLEGTPNQRIPYGVDMQTQTRHQSFTLASAGSNNNFLSTLTGNAVRGMLLIVRDSTGARQDYLGNPIQWQLDERNLGTLAPDIVFQWAEDFYRAYGGVSRPTGVYPFSRFYSPGVMYGQSWLYTSNSTRLSWTTSTATGAVNMPGTVELLQEEVFSVGAVDPTLIDM